MNMVVQMTWSYSRRSNNSSGVLEYLCTLSDKVGIDHVQPVTKQQATNSVM